MRDGTGKENDELFNTAYKNKLCVGQALHQIALGQLELARELMEETGKLDASEKELIETSIETLERSSQLIDNVRKLQKMRAGEYQNEIIDLGLLLAEVVEGHSGVPGKDVTFDYHIALNSHVKANLLLKDVFNNIVGNEIKHSHGQVKICINISNVKHQGSPFYRVAIEDNGPGIPDEKKEEVFHRFKRGQTKARGTGLGLYIVKTLVESYNGSVIVEDRVPGDHTKGSRFVVLLPVVEK